MLKVIDRPTTALAFNAWQEQLNIGLELIDSEVVTGKFKVYDAYPNPFANQTTVGYYLPDEEEVSVTIYNLHGKVIKAFENNFLPEGYHQLVITEAMLGENGIYFCQIQTSSDLVTLRLIKH